VGEVRVATGVAAHIEALLHEVFAELDVLRDLVVTLYARAGAAGRRPSTGDLAEIRPTLLRHLSKPGGRLNGTGVIPAPGMLADQARWLEWWRKPGNSTELRPLSVDLDPQHVGGYDYPAAEWFDVPYRTGNRVIVGPYVDYGGTDEYILTFSRAVYTDAGFFAVAAADIRATDFERDMLPLLDTQGPATLLLNAGGRVLASNTPANIIGSLAPPDRQLGAPLPGGLGWADCVGLPWSLVRG
jgi:hypothetical protein